jgi:TetR/AcrR family transcriptional regulator, lmrAB and yxaGH operons repressor
MTESTRERFLTAAAKLLQERGYRGTSLNDILAASGAPRGSLYYHFPGGKEELVREATRREVRFITDYMLTAFRESAGPVEAIRAYVEGAREHTRTGGFLLGCPVASLVLDSPEASSSIRAVCEDALAEWHGILREGMVAGGVRPDRADALATLILTAVEGALIVARSQRDTQALDTVAEELASAVSTALPKTRRAG